MKNKQALKLPPSEEENSNGASGAYSKDKELDLKYRPISCKDLLTLSGFKQNALT